MKGKLLALGVIPARIHSTRFPRKVVANILGKPLIQHMWEIAVASKLLQYRIIATDDSSICDIARGFGADVVVTPADLNSGTERTAFVAQALDYDPVVNLQADEPLLKSNWIDRLVSEFESEPSVRMATLAVASTDPNELRNPNVVKVVTSEQGDALYFSRQPLACNADGTFLKHIGIYAYRRDTLLQLAEIPGSPLEKAEKLEQLRALENGIPIRVLKVESDTIAVDTPADIERVESYLMERSHEE